MHKLLKPSTLGIATAIALVIAPNVNAAAILETTEPTRSPSIVTDEAAGRTSPEQDSVYDRHRGRNRHRQIQCNNRQILTAEACSGDEISAEERKLYRLVNQYRSKKGLPPIPLSTSLNKVANRHVRDLQNNFTHLTHAWSNCPYDSNRRSTFKCMWEAPQRLGTSYRGYGYENAYGSSSSKATAEGAFAGWLSSRPHNDVISNRGIWQDVRWNALGIGIYKGYAVLWFGKEKD
ncbi:CAP domain-containing protein [filamentous cyanobacterium LEGE 11480]|uniref:CAP domain-containing protein n=1 Tax=Romeriopsis navalis LEGE 11480 TaxID=2777977 RepID=A0A928Z5X1_9CYAN|nr:CAP domain-containing protein [Romeriopsis navalis]MBE9032432.1 CAP domain-containing protein [Romeriopsis navalis LEGE 11480]